jgi:hypothetical protein
MTTDCEEKLLRDLPMNKSFSLPGTYVKDRVLVSERLLTSDDGKIIVQKKFEARKEKIRIGLFSIKVPVVHVRERLIEVVEHKEVENIIEVKTF